MRITALAGAALVATVALAAQIQAEQSLEILQMQSWLTEAGKRQGCRLNKLYFE